MQIVVSHKLDFVKGGTMYVQMYWLLVKKEYIIVFVYIILSVVFYTFGITAAKWIAHVHSVTGQIFGKPWPKGIVIYFVDSNHV